MNIIYNTILLIGAIVFSAIIWRRGGAGQSLWRNPGVPIVLGLTQFVLLNFNNWWALLYIPLMWGAIQAFSYGLNAPIHQFVVLIMGGLSGRGSDGGYKPVEIVTRATCGLLWSTPAILFAILTGNWLAYGIYAVVLTIGNGLAGGLIKDVEKSEKVVGGLVSLCILI